MSVSASIEKLAPPIKDLVSSALQKDSSLTGGEAEKDVAAWIDKVAIGDLVKDLKALDTELTPKTYLVSSALTAADVSLYGALYPAISQSQPAQYFSHPAVTRYFDHVQSTSIVRGAASNSFPLVNFDFTNAPKLERKADPPKKKDKAPAGDAPKEPVAAGSKPKKEKKEKAQPLPKAPAADDGPPVPSMIDLRVGKIVDVKKHPDADSLYIEQIDIGEEAPRTVVSGLVKYVPIEEMQGKYLIAVCNLKPATMRGVKSFAMVLCATSPDGKDAGVEICNPPPNAKPGDRVYFEGADFENASALPQLNPKKKIFETIQPGFTTLDTKECAWVNPETKTVHRIRTKDGVVTAPTYVGASLS
ncbi:hypothetical protein DL96DRAFT_1670455 [Flagelloscypha sp. PMI_526]|nr:hypothetical protein DL96DRAFT_1670455 [Flagelloscypha sp. PMI_526]